MNMTHIGIVIAGIARDTARGVPILILALKWHHLCHQPCPNLNRRHLHPVEGFPAVAVAAVVEAAGKPCALSRFISYSLRFWPLPLPGGGWKPKQGAKILMRWMAFIHFSQVLAVLF